MIFWFALNIEKKDAVRRMFSGVKVEEFYMSLSMLPSDYRIWIGKFASYRPKKYDNEEEKPVSELELRDIISYVDRIKNWSWEVHLQVGKSVYFDVLSKNSFISEFKKAIKEVSNLQNFLNDLVQP